MPESVLSTPSLAAIVAVVVALAKVIEVLVTKSFPTKSVLTDEERSYLKEIHEIHIRTDNDGTPLVYTPRTFMEMQKDFQKSLMEVVNHQARIAELLDRIEKRLER